MNKDIYERRYNVGLLAWLWRSGEDELDFLPVYERRDVVGRSQEGVATPVGYVHPPVLLLVIGEKRAVDRVRHPRLALQSLLASAQIKS